MRTLSGLRRLYKILFLLYLLLFLTVFGCGSGDGGSGLDITGHDNHTPIEIKLVHGTLLVVKAVVNDSMNFDMLVDTGSSRTHVSSEIFGNPNGEVYISSLCLENGLCFNNFMAWSSDSAFTQNKHGYFNGIIGIDLLRNFDVTFDYKNELIYFYDTLENDSAGLKTISFQYQSSRPYANVSIKDQPQGSRLFRSYRSPMILVSVT